MKAPKRKPDLAPAPLSPEKRRRTRASSPELIAHLAVARKPQIALGQRVKFSVVLYLAHDVAEALVARAIREGTNSAALGRRDLHARDAGSAALMAPARAVTPA